ncbi:MAG: hypothetical protein JEZ07_04750 [Phycisphaerae bacterium]|nr:hypothetical protein [Phycisphaerae bacterium]
MKTQKILLILIVALAGDFCLGQTQEVKNPAQPSTEVKPQPVSNTKGKFDGYDFEQVVINIESSVNPLQEEMGSSLKAFSKTVAEAEQLIEQGQTKEAIQKCSTAMDAVLGSREKVLNPMWEGQEYLTNQIDKVRARLAKAVEASANSSAQKIDKRSETVLDGIAKRLANENDPTRKKRLIAHYKTIRQLAQINALSKQLTPNQQKLWGNVLKVLENTAFTHQRVLMQTEVLFAQFEATTSNLKEYNDLIITVEGASELLNVVKGLDQNGQGLNAFSENMVALQQQLSGFSGGIENVLEETMTELEAQAETIEDNLSDGKDNVDVLDNELQARLNNINKKEDK